MYFRHRNLKNTNKRGNKIEEYIGKVKKYKILNSLLQILTVVSVNFAGYIAYYDINIFMMIDMTAITKYVFGLVIIFALVSAIITLAVSFLVKYYLLNPTSYFFGKMNNKISSLGPLIKFPLIFTIFSFIYVGWINTIYILLIFLFYFGVMYLADGSESIKQVFKTKNINIFSELNKIKTVEETKGFFQRFLNYYYESIITITRASKEVKLKDFILGKIGIMLLLLSFSLGIGRADFVQSKYIVKLNNDEKTYILFLNTFNGIFLFDKKLQETIFVSNDNLHKLVFIKDVRRGLADFE